MGGDRKMKYKPYSKYKDSGIEWIGEIPDDWKINKVKFLLNSVLSDEKRHHELLKQVLDIIVHGETITEDDWWKLLWENVPFHGAPGG